MIETWINELTNQTALSTNDYLILIQNLNELVENEHLCWSFLSLIFMLSSGFIRSWHVPLQLTAVTRRIINSSSSTTFVCSRFFIVFCEACARGTWPKRVAPNVPTFRAYWSAGLACPTLYCRNLHANSLKNWLVCHQYISTLKSGLNT